jgi:hypothetical protein
VPHPVDLNTAFDVRLASSILIIFREITNWYSSRLASSRRFSMSPEHLTRSSSVCTVCSFSYELLTPWFADSFTSTSCSSGVSSGMVLHKRGCRGVEASELPRIECMLWTFMLVTFPQFRWCLSRFCQLTRRTISPGGEGGFYLYDAVRCKIGSFAVDIYRCFALFISSPEHGHYCARLFSLLSYWEVSFFALDFFPR